MSNSFNTPNTQPDFNLGTLAQPAGGGYSFGAPTTGAGDANKTATPGLGQTLANTQAQPYSQPFATSFASPKYGGPPTGTSAFGITPTATTGFGTQATGTTGFPISQPKSTAGNIPASTNAPVTVGLAYGTPIGTSMAQTVQPVQLGYQTPTAQPTSSALGALSTPSTAPGFTFVANQAATATPALPFNLGGTPATSGSLGTSGISFGAPKTNISGILSGPAPTTSGGLSGLNFGQSGISGIQTPASSGGFSVAGSTLQTVPSTGSTLVSSTPALSSAGGFSLSGGQTQIAQTTGSGFNLDQTVIAKLTPASTTGFSLGTSGLSLGTPASGSTFPIGSTAPTTAAPTFNPSGTTTAASTQGFTLGKSAATPASTAPQPGAPSMSLGTATNVTSSTVATSQPSGLNFCQLEESINKWTLELEEQEKAFVNQATQVNSWDKLLIANGEKIVTLNQEVERVKLEQQQLDHELDYVVGQQRELQDCLVPLEKELASVSASDPEREYTYRLSENLDTQLKQMSEDLKEIIEHLNEANRSQDSSDPIVQIGKILNAHMNSLQWLDQRTAVLQTKIQQIDQLHQNFRQEHERSFNLAYN